MKLDAVLALLKPHLAADAKPEEIKAAILAADKAAKDKAAKDAAGSGLGSRELEENDKAKDKAAKDEKEGDEPAKDGKDDEPAKDEETDIDAEDEDKTSGADPSTAAHGGKSQSPAIDSAEVDRRIAAAVAGRDALHTALREVEPILGVVAFDSAPKAYRAALDALNVDTKGVPNSALPAMLKLVKDRSPTTVAMDSAGVESFAKVIPGYGRLK